MYKFSVMIQQSVLSILCIGTILKKTESTQLFDTYILEAEAYVPFGFPE